MGSFGSDVAIRGWGGSGLIARSSSNGRGSRHYPPDGALLPGALLLRCKRFHLCAQDCSTVPEKSIFRRMVTGQNSTQGRCTVATY